MPVAMVIALVAVVVVVVVTVLSGAKVAMINSGPLIVTVVESARGSANEA